jgi:signal transduction histidine kinase
MSQQLTAARPAAAAAAAPGAGEAAPAGRLALQNWRVPWRLVALIALPTVTAMIFAGLRVGSAADTAASFGRVEQLAVLGQQVTGLAQAMETECDASAAFIAAGRPASAAAALRRPYAATDARAAQVTALARQVGAGFPHQTRAAVAAVRARIGDLHALRSYTAAGNAPPAVVVDHYSLALTDLFTLDDDVAQEGGNAALVASVRALGSLSRMKDAATQQQAVLAAAYTAGGFAPGTLNDLTGAQAQQASDLASFMTSATLGQSQALSNTVAGPPVDQAQAMEQAAVVTGSRGAGLSPVLRGPWSADMTYTVARMRLDEQQLAGSVVTQARALHQGAERSALLTGLAALVVLVIVLMITVLIARSMVRPLRTLRAGALEIADLRLPGEVARLSEPGSAVLPRPRADVEPIGVHSTDEIGQVARAFDRVHREALRLAADEAALRNSVSAMFVSLSRRSQSLLERLLRQIDSLELGEDDPDRLAQLFRMDHLATRMRRNSENLLVLAGHETPRRPSAPVPLVNVVRAAVSEIEQYDRVVFGSQPAIAITGAAVTDTVHLLAELLENATIFSARDTRVSVAARELDGGAVAITVTDDGMGMTSGELTEVNQRLADPPAADVAVSRHMGLFAVAHLAARNGVQVELASRADGGTVAQVTVPAGLAVPAAGGTAPEGSPAGPVPPAFVLSAGGPLTRPSRARAPHARRPAAGPAGPAAIGPSGTGPASRWPGAGPDGAAAAAPAAGPPAASPGFAAGPPAFEADATLPIFEAVESDWFRARGRRSPAPDRPLGPDHRGGDGSGPAAGRPPAAGLPGPAQPVTESGDNPPPAAAGALAGRPWTSPGDDGWRAAQAVLTPVTAGLTEAGLPRRTPQANLVPGSAGQRAAPLARPGQAAELARARLAGFQRGSLRARGGTVPAARPPDPAS